jgi:hypothetical protein
MKAGLFIFGLIILIGMFVFSNVLITPEQKQQVQLANSLCNANVNVFGFNLPIGQSAQALSPDIAQRCQQVSIVAKILSYEMYIYIVGFVLIVLGLALGGSKEVVREIVKEKREKKPEKPEEETEEKESEKYVKKKGIKYCSECGSSNKISDKFCGSCGKKLK